MSLKKVIPMLLLFVIACVDPYKIEDVIVQESLVVEGVFSNQVKKHQIFLSRSTAINQNRFSRERGATVSIEDDEGSVIQLSEESPGVYETPVVSAQAGHSYTLKITTADGTSYVSKAVAFTDGPDIADVYAKYIDNPSGEGKGIQVFLDTEENTKKNYLYRFNYIETYEVHAPFPSNWIWTGGTKVEFRYKGIDTCYVTDTLRNIILTNTERLNQSKIEAFPIRYIDEKRHILRYRYSILVQQFSLSKEAYEYWENIRKMSETQGTLSDLQPGSLKGNLSAVDDERIEVLGYFDVGRVSEKRIKFSAINFYNDGMKMPPAFRNYCYEVQPVSFMATELPSVMPTFLRTMNIWEVAGLEPNTIINMLPITCTDCRDQGPTTPPDFFLK